MALQPTLHSAKGAANVYNEYNLEREASPPASLEERLAEAGLECSEILDDGNCLFRTLSHQLTGDESYHLGIRKEICRYIEDHAPMFMPFFPDEDNRSFREHLQAMRCPREYGGQAELAAFANLYNRRLHIFHDVDTEPIIMEPFPVTLPSSDNAESASSVSTIDPEDTLYLVFRSEYEHYDSTLPITEQSASPAQHNSDEESSALPTTRSGSRLGYNPVSKRTLRRNLLKITNTTSCQDKKKIKCLLRENNNGLKKVRRILKKEDNRKVASAKLPPQGSFTVTPTIPVGASSLTASSNDQRFVSCQRPSHRFSLRRTSPYPAVPTSDLKRGSRQIYSQEVSSLPDSNILTPPSLSPKVEPSHVSLKSARRDEDEESTCSKRLKTTSAN